MSISNQTYKELAIPYFKEVFDIIDEVMLKLNVPYYLIGASAIALELLKDGIKPSRGTKDIDFAIMISSIQEFETIVMELSNYGFKKVEAPWTLYNDKFNIVIDLLPFGEIEEKFTVNFNKRYTDLHVLGFSEVLQDPETVQIEEKIVQIPSLPGMVILKLIAWSDRPEERDSDLGDILRIIEHYFSLNLDEIIEFHNDIFPEEGELDQLKIAARVLGRKASQFLDVSPAINERILKTINENVINVENSEIAKQWIRGKDWDLEYAVEILEEIELGLVENDIIKG
ncbi:nucleotidyltransferase AbiEii toxin of type IV toxin-antitoxin system [Mariniflexile fucanivorans]|uniref:Nucleotidyltransferase AbiEii toxin of type IV toxin-antitoxin system n=1 Tax=Mariniflexile fucanivorans TaxID=264023 RepID=A0A4R1RH67_9FLAO|nr:nucleotidyl transferase AbiEii/AbiGii toxin family protein [Mariniflexile fucanivorans]TCL65405.1 nucleotidyltransferase AbiEii toxin of type IV toxin-antitoxin system [Mariniflexile fucanivorans]